MTRNHISISVDDSLTDIPPTEPIATRNGSTPAASPTTDTPRGRLIAPDALTPRREVPAADRTYWYWVGATRDCPRSSVDVAGISFAQVTEIITKDKARNRTVRTATPGTIIRLTEAKLQQIASKLSRMVFRFRGRPAEETAGAEVLDKTLPTGANAVLVRIPTDDELAAAAAQGRIQRPYVAQHGDRPVSDFLYCVPLPGSSPAPRAIAAPLPEPLSTTGIELPDENTYVAADNERPTIAGMV